MRVREGAAENLRRASTRVRPHRYRASRVPPAHRGAERFADLEQPGGAVGVAVTGLRWRPVLRGREDFMPILTVGAPRLFRKRRIRGCRDRAALAARSHGLCTIGTRSIGACSRRSANRDRGESTSGWPRSTAILVALARQRVHQHRPPDAGPRSRPPAGRAARFAEQVRSSSRTAHLQRGIGTIRRRLARRPEKQTSINTECPPTGRGAGEEGVITNATSTCTRTASRASCRARRPIRLRRDNPLVEFTAAIARTTSRHRKNRDRRINSRSRPDLTGR